MRKKINVNIWDDYCQEPEYDFTDPTTINVESLDKLSMSDICRVRDFVYERCLEWKEKSKKNGDVEFQKDLDDEYMIGVWNLDEDRRKDLYDFLKKGDNVAKNDNGDEFSIQWLMES